jgi:hypothetical protein
MTSEREAYADLGLTEGASPAAIRTAYRRLARLYHPDRSPDPDSVGRMIELNAAWETLRPRPSGPTRHAGRSATERRAAPIVRRTKDGRDIVWERGEHGVGAAGPPPGRPKGAILEFGRYLAWSLGEVARHDPWYLLWLDDKPEADVIRDELETWLQGLGLRRPPKTISRRR